MSIQADEDDLTKRKLKFTTTWRRLASLCEAFLETKRFSFIGCQVPWDAKPFARRQPSTDAGGAVGGLRALGAKS